MSTNRTSRSRRRGLLFYVALALGALALLGACTDEEGNPVVTLPEDVELPDVTLPAPEEPAPEEPAPEQPAPEEPADDEGLTTEEWVLLGILGVLVIAVIIGATSAATRHSAKKGAARAGLNGRLSTITGTSRWVLDQASVETLRISDPAQLTTSWAGTRTRIIDLESDITVLMGSTGDSGLDQSLSMLGQNVAGLRGSLDTLVSLRTSDAAAGQQALIDDAARTVQERRQQLSAVMAPVEAAQR